MVVREVMQNDVAACAPERDLASVVSTMRACHCGFLPVVDSRGVAVGVVTDRDICLAVQTHRLPAHVTAREVMSPQVFACAADDNLKTALATMSKHRVRRLPVLDMVHGNLQGVLSLDDIVLAPRRRGGPTSDDIVATLKAICTPPAIERRTA